MRYLSVCSGEVAAKTCARCKVTKPLSEFHRQPAGPRGRHSWCKPCANSYCRENRKRNYSPEQRRQWQVMTRYKLTMVEIESILNDQDGKCGICRKQLTKYHIDHNHDTGVVRGLLFHRCNIRIGGWDEPEFRTAALAWLGRGK